MKCQLKLGEQGKVYFKETKLCYIAWKDWENGIPKTSRELKYFILCIFGDYESTAYLHVYLQFISHPLDVSDYCTGFQASSVSGKQRRQNWIQESRESSLCRFQLTFIR